MAGRGVEEDSSAAHVGFEHGSPHHSCQIRDLVFVGPLQVRYHGVKHWFTLDHTEPDRAARGRSTSWGPTARPRSSSSIICGPACGSNTWAHSFTFVRHMHRRWEKNIGF